MRAYLGFTAFVLAFGGWFYLAVPPDAYFIIVVFTLFPVFAVGCFSIWQEKREKAGKHKSLSTAAKIAYGTLALVGYAALATLVVYAWYW
jgi:hypothetical protein